MNVVGIDHLVLYAEDVDAVSTFYADLLEAEAGAYGPGRTSVYLGDVKLNVRPVDAAPEALVAASPAEGAADFCLVTDRSVDAVVGWLDDNGIDVVEGPVERDGARGTMTSVYFRDPVGNLVEVATYPDRDE